MSLPSVYKNELDTLNRELLQSQPADILQFCANYFNRRLESQRAEYLITQQQFSSEAAANRDMAGSNFPGGNPFSGGGNNAFGTLQTGPSAGTNKVREDDHDRHASPTAASFENDPLSPPPQSVATPRSSNASSGAGAGGNSFSALRSIGGGSEGFPNNYSMGRRTSVSAESLNPTASENDNWTPPFHQKTPDQMTRLRASVANNFLFSHLDKEQTNVVLGALVEKAIPAKDIKVIIQGDAGDYFYIVEKGNFDIFVNDTKSIQPGPGGMGTKVTTIGTGGSFGELALMYNAPRAATVISTEANSTLWALDRVTFRRILMDSAFQRRRMYESFIEEVPLLSTLNLYERSKIADALDTQSFPAGSTIIREGDPGEAFFILENGEAEVFKRDSDGKPLKLYKKGDYFGELALLNDAPRAASVVSKTEVKVATLGKDGFQRLLGPVEGIMRRDDPSKHKK